MANNPAHWIGVGYQAGGDTWKFTPSDELMDAAVKDEDNAEAKDALKTINAMEKGDARNRRLHEWLAKYHPKTLR